jgi:acetate---CoA ligase (ADP-forming) subunit beta
MNIIRSFLEKNRGRTRFLEHEVKGLLGEAGLPVPRGFFLGRGKKLPERLEPAYPLAAKVSSAKISGKSDVQGVRLGITDFDELKKAVDALFSIENSEGVLIEEMAPQGVEVIVGGVIDAQFGPIVMFGLGGVFVEIFRDVAFGLAPLSEEKALRLVRQVRGSRLLEGYRGKPPLDAGSLLNVIVVVSEMMASGLLEEIDLNPVALYPKGAMVLDAKMSARQKQDVS